MQNLEMLVRKTVFYWQRELELMGARHNGMDDYETLIWDVLGPCIKALDSRALPDGPLRDQIKRLAQELTLESARTMTDGIYEKRS